MNPKPESLYLVELVAELLLLEVLLALPIRANHGVAILLKPHAQVSLYRV